MENKSLDQLLSNDIHSMLHEEIGYVFPEDSVIYTKILSRLEVILTKSLTPASGVTDEEIEQIIGLHASLSTHDYNKNKHKIEGAIWMRDRMLSVLYQKDTDLNMEVKKLQDFKDYVHSRLDEAGIEKEPNGEHSKHGCRIGDRLDLVLSFQSELEAGKVSGKLALGTIFHLSEKVQNLQSELESVKNTEKMAEALKQIINICPFYKTGVQSSILKKIKAIAEKPLSDYKQTLK